MIIFDLDGTLADCSRRRHFVDPIKAGRIQWVNTETGKIRYGTGYENGVFQEWKPDWKAFYEACDKDTPIYPVREILWSLDPYKNKIQIWSGRCESVREKTEEWLIDQIFLGNFITLEQITLRMRPIGDNTPDDQLKESWLDEYYHSGQGNCPLRWATHDKCCKKIDFVFDDCPKVVRMWQRRGIFVFNCCQHNKEF